GERAAGERNGGHVVARRPGKVLDHLAVAGPGQPDDGDDAARVAAGQHDAGRLDGHVGAGADGDADVGPGQGGSVVDAVTDHGHRPAPVLEGGDGLVLILRQDLGEDLVNPEFGGDRVGDLAGVAGDHG